MLTHLSLFSGIGGLDLAAEWAGFTTVGQCEWADYPTKVLEKHWPAVERWRDVGDFTAKSFRDRTGIGSVTVLSGGFPCQPHSCAGKRKASGDERDLWPEYRRVISEIRPKWVVAENVPGLLSSESGRFFRGILRDLSELGFDVGWCTYPAAWVGATHRRERVFTIAHANSTGTNKCAQVGRSNGDIHRQNRQTTKEVKEGFRLNGAGKDGCNWIMARWGAPIGIFEPRICGADNEPAHWVDRLKCLGNAVVPQQAYPIFKAIADIERGEIDG
jgi:DNA (cytosine-5)-methyltransferase 1